MTLRDARTGHPLQILNSHDSITGLAYRPDSRQLAVAVTTNAIRVWDLPSGPALALTGQDSSVHHLCWSPDDEIVASGSAKATLQLFDASTGEVLCRLPDRAATAFSADSRHLLCASNAVLDLLTGKEQTLADPKNGSHARSNFLRDYGGRSSQSYRALGVGPNGDRMIEFVTNGVAVKAIDDTALAELSAAGGKVSSVTFRGDGRRIVMNLFDGGVRIFDGESYALLDSLPSGSHGDECMTADFSPDGTRLATGSRDNLVRIYDAKTLEHILDLEAHTSHVAAVQWSSDGTRLASAGGDSTIRIWDSQPRQQRTEAARIAAAERASAAAQVEAQLDGAEVTTAMADKLWADCEPPRRPALLRVLMARWLGARSVDGQGR